MNNDTDTLLLKDLTCCELSTYEMTQLDATQDLEPCIVFQVDLSVESFSDTNTNTNIFQIIPLVQVTPSNCSDWRDGAVTGV
jgi:hypothetical protein